MSFNKVFDAWKKNYTMNGPHAKPRFIMMKYMERLAGISNDFVFKGGNLLWFYIQTPRPTVDLDFVTNIETDVKVVIEKMKAACESQDLGIRFEVLEDYKVIEENEKTGIAINVKWSLEDGASNKFGIDIVLGVQTDTKQIQINKQLITAASMENIIIDKFSACHDFGSGNTRAKDYDDLFRITFHADGIDFVKLKKISELRRVSLNLDHGWIGDVTEEAWAGHLKKYRTNDLPKRLDELFEIVNDFFSQYS